MRQLLSTTTPVLGLGQPLLLPQQDCEVLGCKAGGDATSSPQELPFPSPGWLLAEFQEDDTHTCIQAPHVSPNLPLWPCSAQGPKAAFGQPAAGGPARANGCGPKQALGFYFFYSLGTKTC